jgi:hypothetical protein
MQGEDGKRDAREKGVFEPYFKCEVEGEKANQYADSTTKGNMMQGRGYFKARVRRNHYADSAARRET